MTKQQAARIGPIASDVTKVWAHRKYPRLDVGE
jgi:catalase